MNRPTNAVFGRLPVLLFPSAFFAWTIFAEPAGTTISYQGRLLDGGLPANGSYDLTCRLFDAAVGGNQIGLSLTNTGVVVSNGLFTAALDFGVTAFNGDARWLEISARRGTNDFTLLSPRQPIAAAPYSITALNPVPITAATNDLNLALSAKILTATNDANSALCAKLAAATNSLWLASTSWVGSQGFQLTNGLARKPLTTPVPLNGTNYVVDFANEVVQLTATNDINLLQSANRTSAGWYGECLWHIQGGATNRFLTVNPNWTPLGALAANMPYLLASNKLALIAFSVRGDSETNVVYAISRQE